MHITSQVEHTKKRNSIDSENKFVKRNAAHQNCLTVCSLHATVILSYSLKDLNRVIWFEALPAQVCVIVSIDWRSPATVLLVLQAN